MAPSKPVSLIRDCPCIEIPSGRRTNLSSGSVVRIMQSLGGSFTIVTDRGAMYRVDTADADALGLSPSAQSQPPAPDTLTQQTVLDQLKTVFDPEIPVNIVDLGLVYSCAIAALPQGGNRVDVAMTMTAPGCGMGNVLKADVENKLLRLSDVKEVHVEVVFDPPWHSGRMSESAKLQLGLDTDDGSSDPRLRVVR
jgi:probable FeS assembly SUF system protein SufT